ncbi:DUF4168 domain-containing protein [Achromobacter sp. GG226]|uniref:DUF4168 domain-containing protein n=1 Tax=Verticiella alkaliphila TaxID=2779529 RepID=UPI001C0DE013|nr:DUF4168 domain-containing protein [Verticiella sp. GG226]MBU4612565.1 DUF4168 domain-containing protein [Verticiella sp. GG226]
MHKRIATFCSAALLCAGVGTAAIAHAQPTSSFSVSESTAPAGAPSATAPATAAPAPTHTAPGAMTAPADPMAGAAAADPMAGTAPAAADPIASAGALDPASVTDAQLQQFVESAQKVAVLSDEYTQRLQTAPDQSAQQQIVAEANDRMASAVQESGLTVDEFNGISEALEQDPQLHARAQQMLQ